MSTFVGRQIRVYLFSSVRYAVAAVEMNVYKFAWEAGLLAKPIWDKHYVSAEENVIKMQKFPGVFTRYESVQYRLITVITLISRFLCSRPILFMSFPQILLPATSGILFHSCSFMQLLLPFPYLFLPVALGAFSIRVPVYCVWFYFYLLHSISYMLGLVTPPYMFLPAIQDDSPRTSPALGAVPSAPLQ